MGDLVNTLCFLAKDDKFLLAKTSSHAGRWWNGIGGPLEVGETRRQGASRRLQRDLGVRVEPADIRELRRIQADGVEFAIMTATKWQGDPVCRGVIIRELKWLSIDEMPWREMYPGSEQWLPAILKLHYTPDLRVASS